MEQKLIKRRSKWMDMLLIIAGTMIMAVGVNMIYDPIGMVTGGISGFAIVIKEISGGLIEGGIPIWLSNVILNIPIFAVGYFVKGKNFVLKSLFGAVAFSVALYIVPTYSIGGDDYLLSAVFGAIVTGVGIALVFMTSTSTGGTDMLSMTLHRFMRHHTVPEILMVIDGVIVVAGAAVFGLNRALYAVIAVFITAKVSDAILEGMKFAKLVYIISDKHEQIAVEIMENLNRGATGIPIKGMYTQTDKNMLFCVVNDKEIVNIKEIVATFDPRAFVIVSDVREAMGEGFIEYRQEKTKK